MNGKEQVFGFVVNPNIGNPAEIERTLARWEEKGWITVFQDLKPALLEQVTQHSGALTPENILYGDEVEIPYIRGNLTDDEIETTKTVKERHEELFRTGLRELSSKWFRSFRRTVTDQEQSPQGTVTTQPLYETKGEPRNWYQLKGRKKKVRVGTSLTVRVNDSKATVGSSKVDTSGTISAVRKIDKGEELGGLETDILTIENCSFVTEGKYGSKLRFTIDVEMSEGLLTKICFFVNPTALDELQATIKKPMLSQILEHMALGDRYTSEGTPLYRALTFDFGKTPFMQIDAEEIDNSSYLPIAPFDHTKYSVRALYIQDKDDAVTFINEINGREFSGEDILELADEILELTAGENPNGKPETLPRDLLV